MKKKDAERIVSIVLWILMVILGADIVIKGLKLDVYKRQVYSHHGL